MGRRDREAASRALENWWQDHSELDYLVAAVATTIAGGSAAAASAALEDFAGALYAHLEVEEDVYFPLIERLAPEHASTIRDARLAHLDLRQRIDALRSHLAQGELEAARDGLRQMLDEFRAHERLEAGLIADLDDTMSE